LACLAVSASRGRGGDESHACERREDRNGVVSESARGFAEKIRPVVAHYCLGCHSQKEEKGELDLERFASIDDSRRDLMAWQSVVEMLEAGEMPPKEKPQPSADERKALVAWARSFLDAEARARAGDPGLAPLRRLSIADDRTHRDRPSSSRNRDDECGSPRN
jgi:hypothetical protein